MNAGERVRFVCGSLWLEGRLDMATGPNAVILSHPHPLYGGEMNNPVLTTLAEVYRQLGYSTLRFNFRGVGASQGDYDDGRGESDDVRAAAAYLAGLGKTVTDLAGYSFGAWINLRLDPPIATVRRQLLIAPPVAFIEFGSITAPPELLIITGDQDRIAPPAQLRELAPYWHPHPRLLILSDADHFFAGGALERLATLAAAALVLPGDGVSSGVA